MHSCFLFAFHQPLTQNSLQSAESSLHLPFISHSLSLTLHSQLRIPLSSWDTARFKTRARADKNAVNDAVYIPKCTEREGGRVEVGGRVWAGGAVGGCRASSVIKFVWLANYDVVFQTPQWAGPARQGGAKAGADREGGSARGGEGHLQLRAR